MGRPGQAPAEPALAQVALVGPPNVGKSTLFNLLTGSHQTTTNAPSTTIWPSESRWRIAAPDAGSPTWVQLVDLPGMYTIETANLDQTVAAGSRHNGNWRSQAPGPPTASEPLAGLPGRPDLAIVMIDAGAPAAGLYLLAQLAQLEVPVVAAVTKTDLVRGQVVVDLDQVAGALEVPTVVVNPRRGRGAAELAQAVNQSLAAGPAAPRPKGLPRQAGQVGLEQSSQDLFDWAAGAIRRSGLAAPSTATPSDRIDRWLLKGWVGVPVFLGVLWGVFELATVLIRPVQVWLEDLLAGPVTRWLSGGLESVGLGDSWFESLLLNGLLAAVSVIVGILPLIAMVFLAVALLEDSGYMTRVALLADRLMRGLGLDGRAVLPLVLGFGCNVPALTATRALPNVRQRLLVACLVPYASCTARLVIFLFMARIFFPSRAGTVVFGLYLASVGLIVLVGWLLRRTAFRDLSREPLALMLPPYQWPRVLPLLRSIGSRCRDFVWQAGRVIVLFSVVVWLLLCVPVKGGHTFGPDTPAQDSLLGAVAQGMAPALGPAGLNDWHATAALVAGVGAKEVAVATMATTFSMDPANAQASPLDTAAQVRQAFDQSSGGYGGAAALAFMVFSLGYLPCIATMAEQHRLLGARLAWLSWSLGLLVAWTLAVATFQIGRLW